MEIKIIVNNHEITALISEEDAKKAGMVVEEKKRTGYERAENGGTYWFADIDGAARTNPDCMLADSGRFVSANYYTDERLARDNARADTLWRKIRRFAAEHGGTPTVEDWGRADRLKYAITFYFTTKMIVPEAWQSTALTRIAFCTEEACQAAIDEYRDELMWYYTEYEPMLH